MVKILTVPVSCLLLTACQSAPPSFASMSEEELIAYNEGKPVLRQVYCVREATSSSYIKRRQCRTVEDWVEHNIRASMELDVLNAAPVYEFPRSINR